LTPDGLFENLLIMYVSLVVWVMRKGTRLFLAGLLVAPALTGNAQTSPPSILTQPLSLTNRAGTYPKFTVAATGAEPLSYQWFKDGERIGNAGYSGYLTNALTVNYARKTNEGAFYVVITNDSGSITSSNATLTVQDPAIVTQPAHLAIPPGGTFTASAAGTAPLAYQWQYGGVALPGATNTSLPASSFAPVCATNPGIYQFVVSNIYGCVTSGPAVLTVNAAVLDPLSSGEPNGPVYATAIQGDGRLVVGGTFTAVSYYARNRLARLLPNGKLDTQFNPNANGDVYCILQQSDGKLLVGGAFTTIGSKTCRYLGRLFPDGTLDTSFNAAVPGMIFCLAWARDGQILAGGVNKLLRFDEAGVIDTTFNPTVSGTIYSIADQPVMVTAGTGIIVGGSFFTIAGGGPQSLARLWPDGRLDTLFNTPVSGTVYALALQRDGGVVLGGQFSKVGSYSRANVARIDLSGRVVEDYNPGATNTVYSLVTQADGKVVLGGQFTYLAGVSRTGLGRLNPDGSIDPTFDPRASSTYALSLQADGKLVVGGNFSSLNGVTCNRLGRLNATGAVSQQLVSTPDTVQWLRSGALPEVDQVVFEQYVPGGGWMKLGDGERIAGGWTASATVTPGLSWRARGKTSGGYCSGSGSIIELVVGPVVILSQPAGSTVSSSTTIPMGVSACGTGPLSYQWFRNGIALAGETNATYDALGLTASYQVVVCNEFGCVQSDVACNWRIGGVETAVRPTLNSTVYALAIQADDKVLIAGSFTNVYMSATGNLARNGLLRLNADGTLDDTFDPNVQGGAVGSLAVMPDRKIVLGGDFTTVGGQPRSCLARLNADGTLDTAFVANVFGYPPVGVYALVPVADDKLLVGGSFTSVGGQSRSCVARLEATGAVDAGFVPPANLHPDGLVSTIVPQSNGLLLLGGHFMVNPGFYHDYMWVTPTGAYAARGYPTPTMLSGLGVSAALQQPDSKLILGGFGFQVDAQLSRTLARLNPDRSPDTTFPAYADGPVLCLAAQADGRVLVGGAFTKLNGVTRNCLGRLYPDGSLDPDFNPSVTGTNGAALFAVAAQPDGKVVLGGRFTNVITSTRYNFARLPVWGPVTESWSYDGSILTWLRDGISPEFQGVTLESSPDGSAWQPVLAGDRISGGWQMNGVSLSTGQQLRVRGQVSISGSQTWQTETLLAPPVIKTQPVSITNALGSIAGFYVGLQGPSPYWCQWYHNGVPLEDGGRVAGAHGPLLTLRVLGLDAGDYWVTVTNLFGSVTSGHAALTTLDLSTPPLILTDEAAFGIHTNHFTFRINAVRGQACIVEYSSNLRTWYSLVTNVATSDNRITFVDPSVASSSRFYRVRLR